MYQRLVLLTAVAARQRRQSWLRSSYTTSSSRPLRSPASSSPVGPTTSSSHHLLSSRGPRLRLTRLDNATATSLRPSRSGAGQRKSKATLSAQPASSSTSLSPSWYSFSSLSSFLSPFSMTKYMAHVLSKPRTIPIPRWITPQNSQISLSECFGHASFLVVATSYAVDDFLMLRIIAVIGSASMLVFTYFHPHGRVLWLPFKWNLLFIAINGYRIFHVYYSRYAANHFLSRELQDRYETSFFLMDKVDYYRLMRHAEIKEYRRGDLIVAQGEQVPVVRMVLNGQLKVLHNGQLTYMLEENNFLSEAGIHIGLLVPGSIESCCTIVADDDSVRLLCWDRTDLVHLMKVHEGLRRSLKAVMSWDIVRKLKGQRLLVTEHLITDPDQWTNLRNQQTTHRYAAILQAVLQSDDLLIPEAKKNLDRYRIVHHIDDATHTLALQHCGWTAEEFAAGHQRRKKWNVDEEDHEDDEMLLRDHLWWRARDFKWYLRDLYLRLMG